MLEHDSRMTAAIWYRVYALVCCKLYVEHGECRRERPCSQCFCQYQMPSSTLPVRVTAATFAGKKSEWVSRAKTNQFGVFPFSFYYWIKLRLSSVRVLEKHGIACEQHLSSELSSWLVQEPHGAQGLPHGTSTTFHIQPTFA